MQSRFSGRKKVCSPTKLCQKMVEVWSGIPWTPTGCWGGVHGGSLTPRGPGPREMGRRCWEATTTERETRRHRRDLGFGLEPPPLHPWLVIRSSAAERGKGIWRGGSGARNLPTTMLETGVVQPGVSASLERREMGQARRQVSRQESRRFRGGRGFLQIYHLVDAMYRCAVHALRPVSVHSFIARVSRLGIR
jgi:hypothetical protein